MLQCTYPPLLSLHFSVFFSVCRVDYPSFCSVHNLKNGGIETPRQLLRSEFSNFSQGLPQGKKVPDDCHRFPSDKCSVCAAVSADQLAGCLGIAGPGGWGKDDDFGCGRLLNWFLHRAVPSARLFSLYRLPATGLLPTAVLLPRCSQLTPAAVCQGQEPPPVFPEKSLPALEPGSASPAGFCIP